MKSFVGKIVQMSERKESRKGRQLTEKVVTDTIQRTQHIQ